jgi:pilus assembly protein CpaF
LSRVENLVSMAGVTFPIKALREQIASAIDVVIQIARHEDGKRRVVSLAEINGMEGDIITMSDIFAFRREGLDKDGNVLGRLAPTGIVPGFQKKLASKGIHIPIESFQDAGGF